MHLVSPPHPPPPPQEKNLKPLSSISVATTVIPRRNWKQCFRKILRGKQGALWSVWTWGSRENSRERRTRKETSVSLSRLTSPAIIGKLARMLKEQCHSRLVHLFIMPMTRLYSLWSRGGAVVRALASHQCCPGLNPGVDAICGLSLLLVFSIALRGFSAGTPVFPSLKTNTSKF